MRVYISGMVWLDKSYLNDYLMDSVRSSLLYTSPYEDSDKRIQMWDETDTHIGLPIAWTKLNYPNIYSMSLDNDLRTQPKVDGFLTPTEPGDAPLKPELQRDFISGVKAEMAKNDSAMASMFTGGGKTVSSLKVARHYGLRTIVCVQTNQLKEGWIKSLTELFGMSREDIGIIQANKMDLKDVTIAMLPTLANKDRLDKIKDYFGFVIVDESSTLGTEFFGEILPKINAKHRLLIDATPYRKDGADVIQFNHVGVPSVIVKDSPMPVKVCVVKYFPKKPYFGKNDEQRLVSMSRDYKRTDLVLDWIEYAYKKDRNIIVVSAKIEHIEGMINKLRQRGIPMSDMGQVTRSKNVRDPRNYKKILTKQDQSDDVLEQEKQKKILFATPKMIERGVDIPRLDFGIEALPVWKATQFLGRIRRFHLGKKYPKWISIRDVGCPTSDRMLRCRAKEWAECGAEVTEVQPNPGK